MKTRSYLYQLMVANKIKAAHNGTIYTVMRDELIVEKDGKKKFLVAHSLLDGMKRAKKRAGSSLSWEVIE